MPVLYLFRRLVVCFGLCLAVHLKMAPVSVKDVEQAAFVKAFAAFLKKSGKLKVPDFVDCVKTAKYKELSPYDIDWFYTRTSSVARHLYIRAPVGVGSLTKIYGGRKRNGVKPAHYCRGSSTIARKALQALEALKLVEKDANGQVFLAAGTMAVMAAIPVVP